ncbi:MAG: hypothetical protein JXN64_11005 [Spirochaetes bacterium]|nr:hypothetical protein [Spirochaetota bacterium]
MDEQQITPKSEIEYLTLVSYFLEHYKDFKSASDIMNKFGDYLTDATNMEKFALMDEHMPSPEDFTQKEYGYRELKDRRGMMDVSFYEEKLISFSTQMFFDELSTGNKASDFFESNLLPFMNNKLGDKNIHVDKSTGNYYCSNFNGLMVTFSQLKKLPGVSVTIIEKAFF